MRNIEKLDSEEEQAIDRIIENTLLIANNFWIACPGEGPPKEWVQNLIQVYGLGLDNFSLRESVIPNEVNSLFPFSLTEVEKYTSLFSFPKPLPDWANEDRILVSSLYYISPYRKSPLLDIILYYASSEQIHELYEKQQEFVEPILKKLTEYQEKEDPRRPLQPIQSLFSYFSSNKNETQEYIKYAIKNWGIAENKNFRYLFSVNQILKEAIELPNIHDQESFFSYVSKELDKFDYDFTPGTIRLHIKNFFLDYHNRIRDKFSLSYTQSENLARVYEASPSDIKVADTHGVTELFCEEARGDLRTSTSSSLTGLPYNARPGTGRKRDIA